VWCPRHAARTKKGIQKMAEYNYHPLTVQIRNYFAQNENNDFVKKLSSLTGSDSIEAFLDEVDESSAIVLFESYEKGLAAVCFSDGFAYIEYNFGDFFVDIPFDYNPQLKKNAVSFDMITAYWDYGVKGRQCLFDDIYNLIKKTIDGKVHLESIVGKKKAYGKLRDEWFKKSLISEGKNDEERAILAEGTSKLILRLKKANAHLKKCRIYILPNETVAQSRKWKDKYRKSPKLTTIRL